jgi:hypothetical protein
MSDVEVSTVVAAPQPEVWDRIASFAGVNHELGPIAADDRASRGRTRSSRTRFRSGASGFRSWVLLFGVIPVDYDDLVVVEIDPRRRLPRALVDADRCACGSTTGASIRRATARA